MPAWLQIFNSQQPERTGISHLLLARSVPRNVRPGLERKTVPVGQLLAWQG
jgi:hypothetical protein